MSMDNYYICHSDGEIIMPASSLSVAIDHCSDIPDMVYIFKSNDIRSILGKSFVFTYEKKLDCFGNSLKKKGRTMIVRRNKGKMFSFKK